MDAIIGQKGVKYGLQVRKPEKKDAKKLAPPKPSIFGDDASDEDEDNVERQIARHASRKQNDKKVAEMHAAALAEDAAVFDYDSHFDSIQEARAEPKRQEKMARESRYIASLLEKAEERKREQDVQYERQLAKERAAEDHLYGDKERFVTAAYKKKLEEEAKWKAEQKQKQQEEEQNAVEKKGHMGDFYRNILRNNVAFGTATAATGKTSGGVTTMKATSGAATEASGKKQQIVNEDDDIMPERRAEMEARTARGGQDKETAATRQQQSGRGGGARGGAETLKMAEKKAHEEEDVVNKTRREERRDISVEHAGGSAADSSRREERRGTEGVGAEEAAAGAASAPAAAAPGDRRNREDAVAAARERYLARKRKAENLS